MLQNKGRIFFLQRGETRLILFRKAMQAFPLRWAGMSSRDAPSLANVIYVANSDGEVLRNMESMGPSVKGTNGSGPHRLE